MAFSCGNMHVCAGLYLSILVALCLLALLMLCLSMASLPSPAPSGQAPAPGLPVLAGGAQVPEPDAINKAIVQALRDADENLKKRIVALATKVCCNNPQAAQQKENVAMLLTPAPRAARMLQTVTHQRPEALAVLSSAY